MRPVPFPDPLREDLEREGARFAVLSGPSGDLTDDFVRPVEAAFHIRSAAGVDDQVMEVGVTTVVIQLEDGDLENLQATQMLTLSVWGEGLPVFMLDPLIPVSLDRSEDVPLRHGSEPEETDDDGF